MTGRIKKIAIILGILTAALVFVSGAVLFSGLAWVRSESGNRQVQEWVNRKIPGTLTWKQLDFSLMDGRISLSGCTLDSEGNQRLASFNLFFLKLEPKALMDGNLLIESIHLDRPRLDLTQDKDGELDIITALVPTEMQSPPKPEEEDSAAALPVNIILHELKISDGTVSFDSIPENLQVALEDFSITGKGNLAEQRLDMTLTAARIRAQGPDVGKVTLNGLSGKAGVNLKTPQAQVHLSLAKADGEKADAFSAVVSRLDVRVDADPSAKTGTFALSLSSVEAADSGGRQIRLDRITAEGGGDMPAGTAQVHLTLDETRASAGPDLTAVLERIALQADGGMTGPSGKLNLILGGGEISGNGSRGTIQSMNLAAVFETDSLTDVDLDLVSDLGHLTLNGTASQLTSNQPEADLVLSLDSNMAQALKRLPDAPEVTGRLKADAMLKGPLGNPRARLTLDYPGGRILGQEIQRADIRFTLEDRICHLERFLLNHSGGRLEARGNADLRQAFPEGFLAPDRRLNALAWDATISGRDLLPGTILETLGITGVSGNGSFDLSASGNMNSSPTAKLTLAARDASYAGYPPVTADLEADFNNGTTTFHRLDLSVLSSAVQLEGTVDLLQPGSMTPLAQPVLDIGVETTPILLKEVSAFLPPLADLAPDGSLALKARISGRADRPDADMTLRADRLSLAGETIHRADLDARFTKDTVHLDRLDIAFEKTPEIRLTGWMNLDQAFELSLDAEDIALERFRHVRDAAPLKGRLACRLEGSGTLADPRLQGRLDLDRLRISGKPIQDITADVQIREGLARLEGRLNFDVNAGFNLKNRDFNGTVIFQDTDLVPWFELAGQPDLAGTLNGRISLSGNADQVDQASATAAIGLLDVTFQERYHIAAEGINADIQGKAFELAPFDVNLLDQGRLTLTASGTIGGDIHAKAQGSIPARAAKVAADTLPDLEGRIELDADARIRPDIHSSVIRATVDLKGLGMAIPETPSRLHDINGRITADMTAIEITDLNGYLDEGTFSISGRSSLEKFMPQTYTALLSARALPVTAVEGLEALFDVDLTLEGTIDKSDLKGAIVLDSGSLTREINLNKEILSAITNPTRTRKGVTEEKAPSPYLDNLTLDVTIRSRENFIVDTNLAAMEIHPDIRIQGTPLSPVVSGRSTIDPGTLQHYNKTFTLTRGYIDFVNPYEIKPELDIQAGHEVRDWNILLSVTGPPDALVLSLSSDPELEKADITSLLLRGKTTTELISSEGGTTFSPENALAQFAASSVQDDLRAATGLDILEMGFNDDGSGGVGNLSVTAGKKLTDKLTVKYGTESSGDGQMVQTTSAEYEMTDTITASGFQNTEGTYGGEIRYRLEFR